MKVFLALFLATTVTVAAQPPEVPHKMKFADLTLTIRDDARKEIEKDVEAFTRYAKSYQVKVDRARTYFPIIEKIFAEEGVPDDFKYLVLQESALIPDAVSVSNAVGFWQFKDFTAIEMGLRVDKEVDERMNIHSSTRAAARYLKKNNTFFDNWLYALQAYQMGAGGVMRSEKNTRNGEKHIEITSKTYWYVKKYLAHKIAYEGAVKGEGSISIVAYNNQSKKSLSDIAKEVSVSEDELKAYNKWVKGSTIPGDRLYAVAIPVNKGSELIQLSDDKSSAAVADASRGLNDTAIPAGSVKKKQDRMKINGIMAIRSEENETPTKLAARAGVDLSAFLKWNDISISDRINPGQYYFLGKKRARASSAYHKVREGESLWSVSQEYGVQIKKLKRFNRMKREETLTPGTTLWLASMKPKNSSSGTVPSKVVEVDSDETFNWDVSPQASGSTERKPAIQQPPTNTTVKEEPVASEPAVVEVITVAAQESVDGRENVIAESGDVADEPISATDDAVLPETLPDEPIAVAPSAEASKDTAITVVPAPVKEHEVKAKETLYAIARLYNVGVMDLVKWNDLDLQQGIKIGQILKVTDPQELAEESKPAPAEEVEHIVKPSDTVYSIARKYGVTIKELMDWNSKKDFNLAVGERLRIRPR